MISPGTARARPPAGRRLTRPTAYVLLLALAAVLLSGCTRVRVAIAVQPDDTVSGEVVVATPSKGPDDQGPQLRVPPRLSDDAQVEPYADGEYVGSRLIFNGLTFEQFNGLNDVSSQAAGRYRLALDRVGGRVVLSGRADLTSIGVDKADFQLRMGVPGEIDSTNGESGRDTVSWQFTPGQVTDVRATLLHDDPSAPSPLRWTLLLALVVALTVVAVVRLASRDRNPPVPAARS